ncbi:hypothetical protein BDZ45DRAFT_719800 [Acephala macrosclerotiorum]|nr:hypothetical protein BDZ45DRAFT_719800 [Acephala macrosclerotiorum]
MHILTIHLALSLLIAVSFSYPTIKSTPVTPLTTSLLSTTHLQQVRDDSSVHPFCVEPQGFTIGYETCTFASAILSESINPSHNGTLANAWIFDPLCHVLGVVQNLATDTLPGGVYNFEKSDTGLQDVVAANFGDGRLGLGSPKVQFAGKTWQGDGGACWWMDASNGGSIWGCVFEFDCF